MLHKSRGYMKPSLGGDETLDALVGRRPISAFGDGLIDIRKTPIPSELENVRCWRTGRFHVFRDVMPRDDPARHRVTEHRSRVLAHGATVLVVAVEPAGSCCCHHPFVSLVSRHTGGPVRAPIGAGRQGCRAEPHPRRARPMVCRRWRSGRIVQGYDPGDSIVALYVHSLHGGVPGGGSHRWLAYPAVARSWSRRSRISRSPTPCCRHAITRRRRSSSASSNSR